MRAVRWVLYFSASLVLIVVLARIAGSNKVTTVNVIEPAGLEPAPTPEPSPTVHTTVTMSEVVDLWNAERELFVRAQEMDDARKNGNVSRCMELMDELLPKAKALYREADRLPLEFSDLGVAANHMNQCVTCNHENARFHCKMAVDSLNRMRSRFDRD